jgi:hypothetical protein
VDLSDHLATYRKGDRIKVRGYFRTIRELVVIAASLEKMKVRAEAAPAPAAKKRARGKAA